MLAHLTSKIMSRETTVDLQTYPLLPGDHGQSVCQASGLDPLQPYLFYWTYLLGQEGASFVRQRELFMATQPSGGSFPLLWPWQGRMEGCSGA